MRIGITIAAALGLAACVGDGAEFGGVTNRVALPAATTPCNLDSMEIVQGGTFVFPGDALLFYYAAGKNMPLQNMTFTYDINELGEPVNIAYTGPAADTRHATKQKLIGAAVNGLETQRYGWKGTPGFAVGCKSDMDIMIRIHRDQI